MSSTDLDVLLRGITSIFSGRTLDAVLETDLNAHLSLGSLIFDAFESACREGTESGELCGQGDGDWRYGRVAEAGPATHGFAVDVVAAHDIVFPQHAHIKGEVVLVIPLDRDAGFDGNAAGWKVYPPASQHAPAVSGGRVLVLCFTPDGAMAGPGMP